MASMDFLDYFLVKERLVDISFRENLEAAKNGEAIDQVISDLYLARKLIYQACKSAGSKPDLKKILNELEQKIPTIGLIFNEEEFKKAWNMTILEIRDKFSV